MGDEFTGKILLRKVPIDMKKQMKGKGKLKDQDKSEMSMFGGESQTDLASDADFGNLKMKTHML